jgi:hypothetical protein
VTACTRLTLGDHYISLVIPVPGRSNPSPIDPLSSLQPRGTSFDSTHRSLSSILSTSNMPNSLTRRVGLTIGPLFLETLVKHYFARVIRDGSKLGVPLLSEELLYDEAFNIAKVPSGVSFACVLY